MRHTTVFILVPTPLANVLEGIISFGPLVVRHTGLETHRFGDG